MHGRDIPMGDQMAHNLQPSMETIYFDIESKNLDLMTQKSIPGFRN